MALDTNPNANMGMPAGGQPGQPPVTTPINGVAAMVKAIMDGQDSYKQQQLKQAASGGASPMSPGSMVPGASGPSSVGGPSGPTPLVNPAAMAGGIGGPPTTPVPGPVGAAMSGAGMGMPNTGGVAPPGAGIPSPSPAMTQGFPTGGGASPVSMDPVTQALMSPIPGMQNGGQQ
jgi:hypothetical protein